MITMMTPLEVTLDFLEFPPTYTCDGGNHSPRITLASLDTGYCIHRCHAL